MRVRELGFIAALAWSGSASAAEDWGVSCRRLTGGAIGLVNAPGTWERLGKSPTFVTASPVLGGNCLLDAGPFTFTLGTEAQFTYVHYDANKDLSTGWLTVTAQAMAGFDQWRFGVHVVGVPIPIGVPGAGLSATWIPGNPSRTRSGIEARLTGFWPGNPAGQLMLLYVVNSARISF